MNDEKKEQESEGESGKYEAAFGLGDGPAELRRGFDPLLDDRFDVGESFAVGLAVRRAAGQLRDFRDEGLVFFAPIDNDLVFRLRHPARLPGDISV